MILLFDDIHFNNAQTITQICYAQSKIRECNLVRMWFAVRKHRALVIIYCVFILLLNNYFDYIIL